MVPCRFLWFVAGFHGFSQFQIIFTWFQVAFMIIYGSRLFFFMVPGPRSVFMVIHGSRLFFYVSRSVFMVNHGSRLVFHGSRSVFYVFFMVPG